LFFATLYNIWLLLFITPTLFSVPNGSYYTGITTNLEKRIKEHNGLLKGGAKYTRGKGPVVLKTF